MVFQAQAVPWRCITILWNLGYYLRNDTASRTRRLLFFESTVVRTSNLAPLFCLKNWVMYAESDLKLTFLKQGISSLALTGTQLMDRIRQNRISRWTLGMCCWHSLPDKELHLDQYNLPWTPDTRKMAPRNAQHGAVLNMSWPFTSKTVSSIHHMLLETSFVSIDTVLVGLCREVL
jgi:hypothetical protein